MANDSSPDPVVRPLARRPPLTVHRADLAPHLIRFIPFSPKASVVHIWQRGLRWWVAIGRLFLRLAKDRLHGKITDRQWGQRLRGLFEEMGGAAVKIGQQLSVRVDLFPYAVCRELEQLVDSIAPFPTAEAIDIIERSMGEKKGVERVPLRELFVAFDPIPIGSASIACVYHAVLEGDRHVAVKVQRPDIERSIGSDLGVMEMMTKTLESLTIVRAGFFKNLRTELRTMLSEELDFTAEARYTRLFRYYTKKDKLKWVTAPKVYTKYCGQRVMVTDFASGFWCSELLAAAENKDNVALRKLAEAGITPKKVGQRLMQYSFWSRYEALFFHADPHHGNIIIQEDSKLVFIDFGSCGTTSRKSKMAQLMIMDRMRYDDVSGTVEAAISTLEPLPLVDVYGLKKGVEKDFWSWLLAFRDKKSKWFERTTAGLWLGLLKETRRRQIPVGLETLRLARSLLLIDTLCFRLDPKMVSPNAFIKWERKAMERGARRARRRNRKKPLSQHVNTIVKESDEFMSRARYHAWQAERFVDSFPNEFAGTMSKWSAFASEALRAGLIVVFFGVSLFLYVWYTGSAPGNEWGGARAIVHRLLRRPGQLSVVLFLLVLFYRRVSFRVNDVDVERRSSR